MNRISLFIFLSLLTFIHGKYNPIPVGSVIISTISKIFVMQPPAYGGTSELGIIYTANDSMTIVNTVYDPLLRNLYIMFTNSTNSSIYICQLISLEQLDSIVYQLPITFNATNVNRLNSFTSDIINRRVFLTDETGVIRLFAMSGLLTTTISPPMITDPIRSAAYCNDLNTLFLITDTKIYRCIHFDSNNLQCCPGVAQANKLRSIAFDQVSGITYVYVLDERTGIYQVAFDDNGCPTAFRPINTLGTYDNLHFAVDRGLYFTSGSAQNVNDNKLIVFANGTETPRALPLEASIVALHISTPIISTSLQTEETCFHGITYSDYRAAVVLAAIFGTVMGIFMCFNALFCIDFFMTKRIIRNLKQQIPHNLLEDRWNKLVEEKYAKLALEKQRKKDDPPPRRISSAAARRISSAATTNSNNTNQAPGDNTNRIESLQVPNPLPKISAYLRRKSESYLNRRRSDDYRSARNQAHEDIAELPSETPRTQMAPPKIHIAPVQEETESQRVLRQNFSHQELLKDADFL